MEVDTQRCNSLRVAAVGGLHSEHSTDSPFDFFSPFGLAIASFRFVAEMLIYLHAYSQ